MVVVGIDEAGEPATIADHGQIILLSPSLDTDPHEVVRQHAQAIALFKPQLAQALERCFAFRPSGDFAEPRFGGRVVTVVPEVSIIAFVRASGRGAFPV